MNLDSALMERILREISIINHSPKLPDSPMFVSNGHRDGGSFLFAVKMKLFYKCYNKLGECTLVHPAKLHVMKHE